MNPEWISAAASIVCCIVTVTVINTRTGAAVEALRDKINDQSKTIATMTKELNQMGKELAVIKYAQGIVTTKEEAA